MLIENVFCFTLVLFMTDGAGADPKVRLRHKLLAPPLEVSFTENNSKRQITCHSFRSVRQDFVADYKWIEILPRRSDIAAATGPYF